MDMGCVVMCYGYLPQNEILEPPFLKRDPSYGFLTKANLKTKSKLQALLRLEFS